MVAAAKTDWYAMVPKGRVENLAWRRCVYNRMAVDRSFAAAMWQACSEDILFWVNTFVWTYDPRCQPHAKLPFVSWDYQDDSILRVLKAIRRGKDLLIEKSRDMGASWICLLVFVWLWMFYPLQSFLLVSRVEDYVDKADNPKALFWKIDFLLKNLPPAMRPHTDRTKLHLFNLDTGSVIDGESTTGDVARGDRRTAILLDEFAAVEQGHKVLKATRDATNCRLFNSTHQGTSTAYYSISRTGILKIRMHWSQHPLKRVGLYTKSGSKWIPLDEEYWAGRPDAQREMAELDGRIAARGVTLEDGKPRSPWYAEQCERAAHAVEIAQELDIDCLGSTFQFFSAKAIEDYIKRYAMPPLHVGDLEFDPDTLDPIGWREDPHGHTRLWMHLDVRGFPLSSQFSLGADVSAGTGASNSALSAVNRVSLEKVLEYANPHIRPEAFGLLAVAHAKWLGNAFLIWEQNGPGRQFGDKVIESGYRTIYYRRDEESVDKVMSDVPGWAPTKDNKRALLGEYRRALELQTFINRSEPALRDCLEYVFLPNGSIEHSGSQDTLDPTGARTNHGDRAIADALVWKACKDRPRVETHKDPVAPMGSFAWRRAHARRSPQRQTAWN